MRSRFLSVLTTALAAAFMLGAFTLVGGFGDMQISSVEASPATSITSISVSGTCGTAGGFTGTVTLNGTFTGTVELGLFYHVPGNNEFVFSGLTADATFNNTSTATYNFASFTFPGANTYRIQVISPSGLGGATVKSNSVPPCTGTPTTTTTTTTTTSSSTTATTTTTTTTGTTTTLT